MRTESSGRAFFRHTVAAAAVVLAAGLTTALLPARGAQAQTTGTGHPLSLSLHVSRRGRHSGASSPVPGNVGSGDPVAGPRSGFGHAAPVPPGRCVIRLSPSAAGAPPPADPGRSLHTPRNPHLDPFGLVPPSPARSTGPSMGPAFSHQGTEKQRSPSGKKL